MGRKKGSKLSEEQKKKISESLKRNYREVGRSDEWRQKVSEGLKGHLVSEETKQKIAEAHTGLRQTDEEKQARSEGMKRAWARDDSVFRTEEYINKLRGKSAWNHGMRMSDEYRKKLSEIHKRRYQNPEEIKKLSRRMRALYRNPAERKKQSDAQYRRFSNMNERKKLSDAHCRRLSDPVVREKQADWARTVLNTPAVKKKVSAKLKGRKLSSKHIESLVKVARRGQDSNLWKGGIRKNDPYPATFNPYLKKKVRRRDGHTCQACYQLAKGWTGVVHHIDGDKQNCEMDNLVLICRTCHNAIHGLNSIRSERIVEFQNRLQNVENVETDVEGEH